MTARYRVTVDRDVCVGNAMCRAIAPGAFVETDEGQSEVGDPASATPDAIVEAAVSCPVGAIFLEDAATGEPVEV
jgi:ferredoxin